MALFPRVTTWVSNQILTAAALNAEFNNILNNAQISSMVGFSANVAQMQQQTTPGGVGSESLAGSGSDEIQRLRFMMAYTLGKSYWYDQTGSNLGAGGIKAGAFGSKVIATGDIADAAITPVKQSAFNYSLTTTGVSTGTTWTSINNGVTVVTQTLTVSGNRPVYGRVYGTNLYMSGATNSTAVSNFFIVNTTASYVPAATAGGYTMNTDLPSLTSSSSGTGTYSNPGDVSLSITTSTVANRGGTTYSNCGAVDYFEMPSAAGTYTYSFMIQAGQSASGTAGCTNARLLVWEG